MINGELLIFTIFGHYIGDFALQTNWVFRNKKNLYILFSHSMIWTGIISAVLLYFGVFTILKAGFLLIGHMVMDRWKINRTSETQFHIYIDQIWHLFQCIIVSILW